MRRDDLFVIGPSLGRPVRGPSRYEEESPLGNERNETFPWMADTGDFKSSASATGVAWD